MESSPAVVVWEEADWRCELRRGVAGAARLELYYGEQLAAAEPALAGRSAYLRAEVLRQRVLRGDITLH